jgi:hypothetical protein
MSSVPLLPARFADPTGQPDKPIKTLTRWDNFLGEVACGMAVPDAMLKHFIKRREIEAITRNDAMEKKRWKEAKLAGLRSAYSDFDLDEFFNRVAMGTTVNDAYMEVFGRAIDMTFYQILREDLELAERYANCLQTKAMLEMEKVIDIIDDDSKDTLAGPKGGEIPNMAAVQRARLKFDGRTKLASAWYRTVYGERQQKVEVNVQINHAERLEEARARARDRRITPRPAAEVIDVQPEPVMDTSWMDEKPMDTTWLEEK